MPKTNSPATSKNQKKNVALSEHVSFLHAIISKTAGQLKRKTFLLKSIVYSDSQFLSDILFLFQDPTQDTTYIS